MSGRPGSVRSRGLLNSAALVFLGLLCLACLATSSIAQERREREPNSVYAERRAKLAAQADGPIVLWGFTGREEVSQAYLFAQEENFYYLTGHNEEGAGLIILPASQKDDLPNVARETLFLPAKNPQKEKWNGVRMSPSDPGTEARTGFAAVKTFDSDFRSVVENLAKAFPNFYTILPYQKELGGYPHEKAVVDWLQLAAPQAKLKDIRAQIGAMRKIEDGDVVVLDVGAQYAGYSADITRTLPANGKFTPRQREIYDIVLGAQNAAIGALKPGADYCAKGDKSVYKLAYNYINSHGKDLHGKSLGPYFIHGLGHHIGLDVHDPGEYCVPLQPGMVVTVEPGIYIPEENLGVRIEDDVLITESGHKLLSERLPRDPVEIEKIMAEAAKQHPADAKP